MIDSAQDSQLDAGQIDDKTTSRLGIRHLILWVAATAVVMSMLSTLRLINQEPVNSRTYLHTLVGGSAYGAALAGIIIGLWRWRQGKRVIVHPGHLFLYLAGFAMLLDLGLTLILSLWAQAHGRTMMDFFDHRQFLGYGASAIVLTAAVVRTRQTPLWCLPLVALLLLALSQVVGSALVLVKAWSYLQQLQWLAPWYTGLPLIATSAATILVVAVIDAFRSGEKRDWMHWAGVAVIVAMAAPHLIEWLMRLL